MLGVTKLSAKSGHVELSERNVPTARPGHVVVEVAAAGICGTDLHIFKNEYKSDPPVTLGHEVCGRVIEVGDNVDTALIGQRFVAETFFSTCGVCRYCRSGRTNLCGSRKSIGSHVDGAMAPLVELPVINLHRPPSQLSDSAASLAEPLACVANSLYGTKSYIEPGDEVLVIGPGAIGLIAAQVARIMGGTVTLRGTEKDQLRLDKARNMQFETSCVGDNLEEERFDVVIECSGSPYAFNDALRFLAKAGHFAQMGLSGRDAVMSTDLICYKELTLTSGFASTPRAWTRAMKLMQSEALDLETLVSETVPLSEWRYGFDKSFAAEGIKYVIDPRQTGGVL